MWVASLLSLVLSWLSSSANSRLTIKFREIPLIRETPLRIELRAKLANLYRT